MSVLWWATRKFWANIVGQIPTYHVIFLAASVYEFNIDQARKEAGCLCGRRSAGMHRVFTVPICGPTRVARKLSKHSGYLSCCRFINDRRILSSSGDMTCMVWDVQTGSKVTESADHLGDMMRETLESLAGVYEDPAPHASAWANRFTERLRRRRSLLCPVLLPNSTAPLSYPPTSRPRDGRSSLGTGLVRQLAPSPMGRVCNATQTFNEGRSRCPHREELERQ